MKIKNRIDPRFTTHDPRISGLYAIADSNWNPFGDMTTLVQKFLAGGYRLIQLRMKDSPRSEILSVAKKIVLLKKETNFTFIINDHPDIATEVGADGVHVGEHDEIIESIRVRFSDRLIVGYSAHSLEEAIHAELSGANYVAFGAIFPTKTKGPGHPVQGLERLKQLTSAIKIPIVAIGGINRTNFQSVIDAGADAVAMITALTQAKDVEEEISWYINKWKPKSF